MVEALLRNLDPSWSARVEVPVPGPRRGVADVVLDSRSERLLVVGEAQSEFRRLEQQLRWIAEKVIAFAQGEEGRLKVGRLLILRSTIATREIARQFGQTLTTAYPARTAEVIDALMRGAPWPGDGIIWMRAERGGAEILPQPPRGVRVGR